MHRDKQVGLRLIGDGGARLKRDEGVVAAGKDYVRAEALLEQLAEPEGHVENYVFFLNAIRAERARVVASVAGIDHDAANLETKRAHHGAAAVGGGVGFVN